MNDRTPPASLPRYDILEGSGVSTLNRLLQLASDQGDDSPADLILRDPQNEQRVHITIVDVTLEHDPAGGAIFFHGTLDNGININGHVRTTPDPETGFIGSANIRF